MSVLIEATEGNIVIDLFLEQAPNECLNFLKLCKIKYYHYSPCYNIQKDFLFEFGNPNYPELPLVSNIYSAIDDSVTKLLHASPSNNIKHTDIGLVSFLRSSQNSSLDSKFIVTLNNDPSILKILNSQAVVFGKVAEGYPLLETINNALTDDDKRPLKDIRIIHTHILHDPFPDPDNLKVPESPPPTDKQLSDFRLLLSSTGNANLDDENDEIFNDLGELQSKSHALTLSLLGDIPTPSISPSPFVLFVCKLNPITEESDLKLIFQRFGSIKAVEIIRDKKTKDSLCYGFIEFENKKSVEDAYTKMNDVLIDDRRIGVDFSQSVKK
ncbi:hypothetical protein CANARDRAFT_187900, partial [[Candida] arabinofermentans NRRL YB-2248]